MWRGLATITRRHYPDIPLLIVKQTPSLRLSRAFSLTLLATIAAAVTVLLLAPSAWAAEPKWYLPPVNISPEGHRFDSLFLYTTAFATFLFLGMTGIILYSMVMFRESRGAKALYDHGGTRRDVIIEILISTAIFVIVDGVLLVRSHIDINEVYWNQPDWKTEEVLRVQVMPQQWAWNIRYPGDDGEFNTEDDVVTLDELRVPTGKKVVVQMISKDVIHSFFLPNVRLKQDANPGEYSQMWFEADTPGDYEIICAEMCGYAHYQMRGEFHVHPPAEFDRWYKEASAWARVQYDPDHPDLDWGWEWQEL